MNRSNVGNVVTNAMQIESVSLTTAAKFLNDASSALNNLSKSDRKKFNEMKANKIKEQIDTYESGGESSFQHLSLDEQRKYREKQADDIRKYINKEGEENEDNIDIDSIMSINSNQSDNVVENAESKFEWLEDWRNKRLGNKNILTRQAINEFDEKLASTRRKDNADV